MNFQILGERVLVKAVVEEKKTASGIIIPDNAKEKPNKAEVVAVSSEVETVKLGDTVVFGKYAGTEIAIDGDAFLILEKKDILGIIK